MNKLLTILLWLSPAIAFAGEGKSPFRLETDANRARIPVLSWDTEGGDRAKLNLLRAESAIGLRVQVDGAWHTGEKLATQVEGRDASGADYRLALSPEASLVWRVHTRGDELTMTFTIDGTATNTLQGLELTFPFDPRATATTILPSGWDTKGNLLLPAIISAPDLGQVLLFAKPQAELKGRLIGSRAKHTENFTLELPVPRTGSEVTLSLLPVRLPAPAGLKDQSLWPAARRGWFNAFQPAAQWSDWSYHPDRKFGAPPGVLANNVLSDPVSCVIHFYADQALLTPEFSPEIRPATWLRRTLDWWLDHRIKPTGEVVAYQPVEEVVFVYVKRPERWCAWR